MPRRMDSRGSTYMKMGQFDTAIDDYNSALRLEPKLASALYGRGLDKLKKGDKVGSDADISAEKEIRAKIEADWRKGDIECSRRNSTQSCGLQSRPAQAEGALRWRFRNSFTALPNGRRRDSDHR